MLPPIQASNHRRPILPARCRDCRTPFSDQSLDYLRAIILAHGECPASQDWSVTVTLLPTG